MRTAIRKELHRYAVSTSASGRSDADSTCIFDRAYICANRAGSRFAYEINVEYAACFGFHLNTDCRKGLETVHPGVAGLGKLKLLSFQLCPGPVPAPGYSRLISLRTSVLLLACACFSGIKVLCSVVKWFFSLDHA